MFSCTKFEVLRPCSAGVNFFFSQPAAGLTNRVLVRDSRAGTPLGSVRFFGHFGRTMNGTDGPVQSNWPNSELNLRFGSKGGPVLVSLRSNAEPNGLYSKKHKFIAKIIIYATYT